MSDILLLPATWRWPVEVHISPLVSLVPPLWCPASRGEGKLAPATVHFGKNLFLNKTVFCCFLPRLFRLGNWELSKDAGEVPLSSWILVFVVLDLACLPLSCPKVGVLTEWDPIHWSLSLCLVLILFFRALYVLMHSNRPNTSTYFLVFLKCQWN